MENLDKTMFTNNEDDLQQIYGEEANKLHANQFKIDILKRIVVEDFSKNLSETSKENIEKALLAVRIRDHITIDNGQKILGLENFDISKISLSYNEKKLIQERFAHLMNLEKIKNSQARPLLTDELAKTQEKFVDLQKENISLIETLANMKQHELELMKEVADILSSSTQKHQVEKILGEAKINQLQVSITNQVIKESEMTKTSHVKKALTEVSGYIDELVLKKEENSK